MLVPLYGFLQGDTLGLLILAHDTMTIGEVMSKLCYSAAVRIHVSDALQLSANGTVLPESVTVAEAGLKPLDRVDILRKESS